MADDELKTRTDMTDSAQLQGRPMTILCNDYFNAYYVGDVLQRDGRPEYLNAETLARTNPDAAIFVVPQDVYDDVLDGAGYPRSLSDFPLDRCNKVR